jgi:hypothetical protein
MHLYLPVQIKTGVLGQRWDYMCNLSYWGGGGRRIGSSRLAGAPSRKQNTNTGLRCGSSAGALAQQPQGPGLISSATTGTKTGGLPTP